MKKNLKDLTKFIGGYILLFVTFPIIFLNSIPLTILGIAFMCYSLKLIVDGCLGNYIKKSVFILIKNKKMDNININIIGQNPVAFSKFIESIFTKDKETYFMLQGLNMLQQLKKEDKHNNLINYGTSSQTDTLYLLRTLKRKGFINIINEPKLTEKKSLLFARLSLGLKPRRKKTKMYNIVFNLTDKKIDNIAAMTILEQTNKNTSIYKKKVKKSIVIFSINKRKQLKKYFNIKKEKKIEDISKKMNPETIELYNDINNDNINNLEKIKENRRKEIERNYLNKDIIIEENDEEIKSKVI